MGPSARTVSRALTGAVTVFALLAACSKNEVKPEDGDCPASTKGYCLDDHDGFCGDVAYAQRCIEGTWVCTEGTIPEAQCRCLGIAPGCICGDAGWVCPDGGAGDGGRGGGGGGGQGGSSGTVVCGDASCATGEICIRQQPFPGGACYPPDGGCPTGSSPSGPCCVADPVYRCAPLPAACNGEPTCACAKETFCKAPTINCTTPSAVEIDCS
jgi:hypothetical protein